jgi:hypothetical protein
VCAEWKKTIKICETISTPSLLGNISRNIRRSISSLSRKKMEYSSMLMKQGITKPLWSKKDPEKTKNNSELAEATQDAQNGLNRQRKGKNSKFSKLSENDIIAKSASQDF